MMNQRIKELARQAGFSFRIDNATDDEIIRILKNADKVEKFAELIVEECADYIQHFYGDIAASSIGNDIKLHFGIEE